MSFRSSLMLYGSITGVVDVGTALLAWVLGGYLRYGELWLPKRELFRVAPGWVLAVYAALLVLLLYTFGAYRSDRLRQFRTEIRYSPRFPGHSVTLAPPVRRIAMGDSSRGKLVSGGIPPDRMVVKPHFLEPPRIALLLTVIRNVRPRGGGGVCFGATCHCQQAWLYGRGG